MQTLTTVYRYLYKVGRYLLILRYHHSLTTLTEKIQMDVISSSNTYADRSFATT